MRSARSSKELSDRLRRLERDRLHGARWTFEETLGLLEETVLGAGRAWRADLTRIVSRVAKAKSLMAPIANLAGSLWPEARKHIASRSQAATAIKKMRNRATRAWRRAVEHGARAIAGEDYVITCSFSETIVACLVLAVRRNAKLRVCVLRSRVGPYAYGERMVSELARRGVQATLLPDRQMASGVPEAAAVVLGADAVLSDGWVINGTPSGRLAKGSHGSKPVWVVCEPLKRHPSATHRAIRLQKGFDLIPASWVTQVITGESSYH